MAGEQMSDPGSGGSSGSDEVLERRIAIGMVVEAILEGRFGSHFHEDQLQVFRELSDRYGTHPEFEKTIDLILKEFTFP